MIDKLTNCPYCGQGVMIKANPEWNEDQILKEAIMRCTCDESRRQQEIQESINEAIMRCTCDESRLQQEIQESINEAEMYIREDFPATEDIKNIFLACCDLVGRGRF